MTKSATSLLENKTERHCAIVGLD